MFSVDVQTLCITFSCHTESGLVVVVVFFNENVFQEMQEEEVMAVSPLETHCRIKCTRLYVVLTISLQSGKKPAGRVV